MNPQQLPLRDIHLPASVSWWPLAPGWWALLLVALATAFAVYRYIRYRRRRVVVTPACKMARRELAAINAIIRTDKQQAAGQLSALLRRLAISLFEQERVAGLTGDAWWRWLDDRAGQNLFGKGLGKRLEQAAYGDRADDVDAMNAAVRAWIDAVCKGRSA